MKFEHQKIDQEMKDFWNKNQIYKKAKEKNKDKQKFYFLDGPPYTSGKVHIGTAWNKVLKDSVLRYKRMNNYDVWDRAGYDMHGLPIENKVIDQLNLNTKEQIKEYGVENFINKCKEFALKHMEIMNEDFKNLAVWMDFDDPYLPIKKEFIEGVWFLIKEADKKGRLYRGVKTMHWCPKCATALAKHELDYKTVTDNSVFVKFKVKNEKNTYLIIWTTTPWTIPFNLGIMVHPDIDYVKVKVGKEKWILAKQMANIVISAFTSSDYKIEETIKGKDLKGLEYEHPFNDVLKEQYQELKKQSKKVHTVVLSEEYVDLSAGTGLVHMAPGCGPEDYEVGLKNNIPAYNTLDEYGVFPKEMNFFAGKVAKKDDDFFIDALKKRNALIGENEVEHEYPFCSRCHSPVVFRTTEQWFFKVEDLKERMREFNKEINWVPDWAGKRWFDSWLENLRDNSITRQRFWGTPIPIWVCDKCDHYEVVGNVEELKKKSSRIPEDLHLPWIDEITYKCPKCNGTMHRIPDVLDVWVDSGTTSWNCLNYPNNKELLQKLYPADFILEGKDQIRGWFNLLLVSSTLAFDNSCFKNVYMHGFIQDASGEKMSKSLGNVISPKEITKEYGVDAFRFYSIGGTNAGEDLNFNLDELMTKLRNLDVLWNTHNYLLELTRTLKINPKDLKIEDLKQDLEIEDKAMLSYLNRSIKEITELYEHYKIDEIPEKIESLFLELSREYIQVIRKRIQEESNTKSIVFVIYETILKTIILASPIIPIITEKIYQNLKQEYSLELESIHLSEWPKENEELIDRNTENIFEIFNHLSTMILSARSKINTSTRWPLKTAIVVSKNDNKKEYLIDYPKEIGDLIRNYTNLKRIDFSDGFEGLETDVSLKNDTLKDLNLNNEERKELIKSFNELDKSEIINNLNSNKEITITLPSSKKEITLTEQNINIINKVEEPYVLIEDKDFILVLDKTQDDELIQEGYLREIIRRIQNSRKDLGLTKADKIKLYVKIDESLSKSVSASEIEIKNIVGASEIEFSKEDPKEEYNYSKEYKIKDKKITVYITKKETKQEE